MCKIEVYQKKEGSHGFVYFHFRCFALKPAPTISARLSTLHTNYTHNYFYTKMMYESN